MSVSDELGKLGELHQRGVLSDEEFSRAKAQALNRAGCAGATRTSASINSLHRSRSDRWLGGVCGGLAQMTGMATWIWRLLMTLLALFGGTGILFYVLLWVFVPEEPFQPYDHGGPMRAN